ncbi:MAG: prolyl oligopeptidase family serine peptidase [Chlamydiota bacterium]
MTTTRPYGSWTSPITASLIVEKALRFGDVKISHGQIYWTEARPDEQGRSVIMTWEQQAARALLPTPYSARSRVHEYGGAAFLATPDALFFSHSKDNHLYSLSADGTCTALNCNESCRYAEPVFDFTRNFIYAIEEEHTPQGEVINRIVKMDPTGNRGCETVCEGHDFYASIALHPDGSRLAFLAWNHPNMPWDGTELWLAQLDSEGKPFRTEHRAGGISESIFQPLWSPDGTLYFVSDRTGWWNLYCEQGTAITPCYPMEAEFGDPQWIFGLSRYGFLENGAIACFYTQLGIDTLAIIDPNRSTLTPIELPFTDYSQLQASGQNIAFLAASPTQPQTLFSYEVATQSLQPLRASKKIPLDPGYLSKPETIKFSTEEEKTAFGFYYRPHNKDFSGPEEEKPPLIVKCHSGPSSRTSSSLKLETQFWTSRGFAFLDVNYGGSTGYGREYRERLKGNWGRVDVDDCSNAALYLITRGDVDPKRLIIKGGSAGGYTALAVLTFRSLFAAGASYYGVSDLEALARETHKFEAHYLDHLIAPYPEHKQRYRDHSPIHHTDQLSAPIIFFQGDQDEVVPPTQSEQMFAALKKKKIPTDYLLFPEEGHGFRKAKTIKQALEAELHFYSKVLHFLNPKLD